MPMFKKYDGTYLETPYHTHTVNDTLNSSNKVALASYDEDGFMIADYKNTIDGMMTNVISINERLYSIEPGVLKSGSEFNTIIKKYNPTSITFTTDVVPNEYLSTASVVSDTTSTKKVYAYAVGTNVYISPEVNNTKIITGSNPSNMFSSLTSLVSINFGNFHTDNATVLDGMFSNCTSLTSLDLSTFVTAKVTSINNLCLSCTKLQTITGIGTWSIPNLITAISAFESCTVLKKLSLGNWYAENLTNTQSMVKNCPVVVGYMIAMNPSMTSVSNMFTGSCTSSSSEFVIDYINGCRSTANLMVNTKSSGSYVKLGRMIAIM